MWSWFNRRNVRAADYSIELRFPGREGLLVLYRDAAGSRTFDGEVTWSVNRQLSIGIPQEMNDAEVARIVPRLAEGLTTLRREFIIVRVGAEETLPEADRSRAATQLRELGYDPVLSEDGRSVRLTPLPNFQRPTKDAARERGIAMMRLVRTIRGKRARIEVLAKSESADGTFV